MKTWASLFSPYNSKLSYAFLELLPQPYERYDALRGTLRLYNHTKEIKNGNRSSLFTAANLCKNNLRRNDDNRQVIITRRNVVDARTVAYTLFTLIRFKPQFSVRLHKYFCRRKLGCGCLAEGRGGRFTF